MKLKQVAILAPPWINKKDTWQLIDLTLILHVEFESGSPMIPVYVALDGRQLSGQMKVIDLQKAKKVETVFLM